MNKQLLIKFGNKVREERMKRGISQEKLGELAKVHRTYVGAVGRSSNNFKYQNLTYFNKYNIIKNEAVGGISPLGADLLRNKGNQYDRTHPTGISVLEGEPSQGGSFHYLYKTSCWSSWTKFEPF